MHIKDETKHQVGFLCVEKRTFQGAKKVLVGTCFWIHLHNFQRNVVFGYLVTAKHVWATFRDGRHVWVRVNKAVIEKGKSGVVYVPLPNKWMFHPDPAVDLAVLPWGAGMAPNYTMVSVAFDEIAKSAETMREEGLSWPPREGEDVIYVGLMAQYAGYERNFPVVRRGHVALITDERVMGSYGLSHYHFIDMQIYPGNSGGPVWVIYPTKTTGITIFLLGVLSTAYPERQELIEVPLEHRRAASKLETTGYYNMGISMVVPTEKLVELLSSPKAEQMRKKDEPKPVKPAPAAPKY